AAARHAGGPATTVIGASSFLGHVLARYVVDAGSVALIDELLTPAGCEVYTYIFDPAELLQVQRRGRVSLARLRSAARSHGSVTLLGVFLAPAEHGADGFADDDLEVVLDSSPNFDIDARRLRGCIAVTQAFEEIRDFGRAFANGLALPELLLADLGGRGA